MRSEIKYPGRGAGIQNKVLSKEGGDQMELYLQRLTMGQRKGALSAVSDYLIQTQTITEMSRQILIANGF